MSTNQLTNWSRTPLRYPGGKGKITRFVGHLLEINQIDGTYIEPFAGGAGVAVNLLLAERVSKIVINDLDPGVHAFWWTVTHNPSDLINRIRKVPFTSKTTLDEFSAEDRYNYWKDIHDRYFSNDDRTLEDMAFDFFMLNRMNVSGILKGGPIGGYGQDGTYNIGARFNKDVLINRISDISRRSGSIIVRHDEASHFFDKMFNGDDTLGNMDNTFMLIDPPYYKQGKNLYNAYATDIIHQYVARQLSEHGLDWKWILTYDDADYIRHLYARADVRKYEYGITYSANNRGVYTELMYASPSLQLESFDNVHLQSDPIPAA